MIIPNFQVKKKAQIAGSAGAPRSPMNRRVTSGAFSQMSPAAIREIKDSFNLLDKDGDGTVSREDLEEMLISLAQDPTDEHLEQMLSSVGSPLTFSSYLTAMSGKLSQLSSREELMEAFSAFDEENKGYFDSGELETLLEERGMDRKDIQEALKGFTGYSGYKYKDFVNVLHTSPA